MSTESKIADILRGDAALVALLTGDIYTDEDLGVQGFRRGDDSPTNNAFDADDVLKPCMVIREGSETAFSSVRWAKEQITAVSQPVELYFYEHRSRTVIEQARQRVYELLENVRLPGTYPLIWMGNSPVYYDAGPIANSTTLRQEWRCFYMKRSS